MKVIIKRIDIIAMESYISPYGREDRASSLNTCFAGLSITPSVLFEPQS